MTFINGLVRKTVMISACMSLVACGQFDTIRDNTSKPEVVSAKQSGSIYKGGAIDVGRMIKMYKRDQLIIAVGRNFLSEVSEDVSKKLPKNLRHMLISALSYMGVKQVQVVPLEVANAYIKAGVKNVYQLDGAITEFDVKQKASFVDNRGLSVPGAEFSFRNVENKWRDKSVISIDLSLINLNYLFVEQTITAQISFIQRGGAIEYGVSLVGLSVGSKGSVERSAGEHRMIRTLLDFASTAIIGRLHGIPYWAVLEGSSPDVKVTSELAEYFVQQKPANQRKLVQILLSDIAPGLKIDGKFGAKSKDALYKFLKFAGDEWAEVYNVDKIKMTEAFDSEFYVNIFSVKPCVESSKRVRELRFSHCYVKPIDS